MKKIYLFIIVALCISLFYSCLLRIIFVDQPSLAYVNDNITVKLVISNLDSLDGNPLARAIVGMRIPKIWTVNSINAGGDHGAGIPLVYIDSTDDDAGTLGICNPDIDYWADSIEFYYPTADTSTHWIVYESDTFKITPDTTDIDVTIDTVYISFNVGPDTGLFNIDYFYSVNNTNFDTTCFYTDMFNTSFNNPIQISPPSSLIDMERGNKNLEVYPDPFKDKTNITCYLPVSGEVEIVVYDMAGKRTVLFEKRYYQAGTLSIEWQANELHSGVYFVVVKAADTKYIEKAILSR